MFQIVGTRDITALPARRLTEHIGCRSGQIYRHIDSITAAQLL